ncbi:MAG: methyltransferase domain-containing protein [Gemmatimonadaceae bacterium]
MTESAAHHYVMGHDDRERRRLQLQGSILNPITTQLFSRAGIGPGQHVLDVGSGVGDVALIAARLVGPNGSVTACDMDADALGVLERRAAAEGLSNVSTITGDVHAIGLSRTFDAVTGRHILIHVPDPLELVRTVAGLVKQGGVVVFEEYDFSVVHAGYPSTEILQHVMSVFRDFFAKARHGNMGTRLPKLFSDAGLTDIEARAEYPIGLGTPDSPFHEWIAESMRSILGRAVAAGIPGASAIDIDNLQQSLRDATVASGAAMPAPAMVGTIGRVR